MKLQGRTRRCSNVGWAQLYRAHRNHFSAHCDYIHYNPVKHRIVDAPKDWSYSTFHRYVEKEIYSLDWGATPVEIPIDVGGE